MLQIVLEPGQPNQKYCMFLQVQSSLLSWTSNRQRRRTGELHTVQSQSAAIACLPVVMPLLHQRLDRTDIDDFVATLSGLEGLISCCEVLAEQAQHGQLQDACFASSCGR
eukprot:GHUV01058221.1.p1 GENE.GHUV01058221.1~~GHUV01058221.1.p1  ORF type:complete len:110 (+),score=18.56 GHUV01058221.1:98-427(+)